jgi:hypothetical protein
MNTGSAGQRVSWHHGWASRRAVPSSYRELRALIASAGAPTGIGIGIGSLQPQAASVAKEAAGFSRPGEAVDHATKEQSDASTNGTADPAVALLLPFQFLDFGLDQHLFIEAAELQALDADHGLLIGIAAAIRGAAGGQDIGKRRHQGGRGHGRSKVLPASRSAFCKVIPPAH